MSKTKMQHQSLHYTHLPHKKKPKEKKRYEDEKWGTRKTKMKLNQLNVAAAATAEKKIKTRKKIETNERCLCAGRNSFVWSSSKIQFTFTFHCVSFTSSVFVSRCIRVLLPLLIHSCGDHPFCGILMLFSSGFFTLISILNCIYAF